MRRFRLASVVFVVVGSALPSAGGPAIGTSAQRIPGALEQPLTSGDHATIEAELLRMASGDPGPVIALLAPLESELRGFDAYYHTLASAHRRNDDYRAARGVLDAWVRERPESPRALRSLAWFEVALGHDQAASDGFSRLLRLGNALSFDELARLAHGYLFTDADELVRQLITELETRDDAASTAAVRWLSAELVQHVADDVQQSIGSYRAAADEQAHWNADLIANLAALYLASGDEAGLQSLFLAAAERSTADQGLIIGRALHQVGEHERAIPYLRQSVDLQPHELDRWLLLAASERALGRIAEAEATLWQAQDEVDARGPARLELAELLLTGGRHAEVIDLLEQLPADQLGPRGAYLLGSAYMASGLLREAVAQLTRSLDGYATHYPTYVALAESLAALGDRDRARDRYREFLLRTEWIESERATPCTTCCAMIELRTTAAVTLRALDGAAGD